MYQVLVEGSKISRQLAVDVFQETSNMLHINVRNYVKEILQNEGLECNVAKMCNACPHTYTCMLIYVLTNTLIFFLQPLVKILRIGGDYLVDSIVANFCELLPQVC